MVHMYIVTNTTIFLVVRLLLLRYNYKFWPSALAIFRLYVRKLSKSYTNMCGEFYICVSVHHKSVIYNKPTRCNSGSIVFINNYKFALHVSDALCVHRQEHYKL